MVDRFDAYLGMPSTPHPLSAAQRTFVEGAEALGATAPADARPLPELPRLSRRELDELVELGLVREATDWRYYVFHSRPAVTAPLPPPSTSPPPATAAPSTRGRYLRTFLFWLIFILIPILFVRLTDPR